MENEAQKSIFREYAATISIVLPFAASYIKTDSNTPVVIVLFGLLMLIAFSAGGMFGAIGFLEFKETRKKSTLIQAVLGVLINVSLFLILLFSAITSYMSLKGH